MRFARVRVPVSCAAEVRNVQVLADLISDAAKIMSLGSSDAERACRRLPAGRPILEVISSQVAAPGIKSTSVEWMALPVSPVFRNNFP